MSLSEDKTEQDGRFESPEIQRLLKYLKGEPTVEFKPSFDAKRGQVSFPEAERVTGLDTARSTEVLDFLADKGILVKKPAESFYRCSNCESRNLILISGCPFCRGETLKSGRALEHMYCGHVDLEEAFLAKNGFQCPKCGKALKALGVDYRRISNCYRCLSCGRLVGTPFQTFLCSNCQKRTPLDETKLNTSFSYVVNPEAGSRIQKMALDLTPLTEVLERHGFSSSFNTRVSGRSGITYDADLLAWYKEGADTDEKPDLLLDVVISAEPLSEKSMSAFMMKTIDVGSQNGMIVAVPELSKPASKLASFYGIIARGCENVAQIPLATSRLLEETLPRIVKRKLGEEETPSSTRIEKSLFRRQPGRVDDQLPILLAMIYEKQGESQKTMRKLLEYLESNDKRLEGLLQRMKDGVD